MAGDLTQLGIGKRAVFSEFGETPLDAINKHLSIEPMPVPDPATLARHDVIIAIKSASVGWVDLIMSSGQYQHMASPPYTPGLEYSGVVAWTGDDVAEETAKPGDEVFVDGFLAGPRSVGNYQQYGGFASYAVAPAEAIRRIPSGFSFDQACNFLGSYETAYHCVVARGRLQQGETILIHGASGATGLAAVHVARQLGAKVIATGRNDEKLRIVKEQGADHVINIRASDGEGGIRTFRDEVKELTDGQGADVVYDGVGGDISLETLRCLKFGARYLIVGWAATPFVAKGKGGRGAPNANMLPTNLIMMKGLDVLGCPTVISTLHDPGIRRPRVAQLMRWVETGTLRPYVSHVYPLEKVKEALAAKWAGDMIGGAVLNP